MLIYVYLPETCTSLITFTEVSISKVQKQNYRYFIKQTHVSKILAKFSYRIYCKYVYKWYVNFSLKLLRTDL